MFAFESNFRSHKAQPFELSGRGTAHGKLISPSELVRLNQQAIRITRPNVASAF